MRQIRTSTTEFSAITRGKLHLDAASVHESRTDDVGESDIRKEPWNPKQPFTIQGFTRGHRHRKEYEPAAKPFMPSEFTLQCSTTVNPNQKRTLTPAHHCLQTASPPVSGRGLADQSLQRGNADLDVWCSRVVGRRLRPPMPREASTVLVIVSSAHLSEGDLRA